MPGSDGTPGPCAALIGGAEELACIQLFPTGETRTAMNTAQTPAPAMNTGLRRMGERNSRISSAALGRMPSPERIRAYTSSSKCGLGTTSGICSSSDIVARTSRMASEQRRHPMRCDSRFRRSSWLISSSM